MTSFAASDVHQQSLGNNPAPPPSPFVGSSRAITAVPAYVNPTAGALYRGVARATPVTLLNTPTFAPPIIQSPAAPSPARTVGLPLSMQTGVLLFVAGTVVFGYDWLRSRRQPAPPAPSQDELLGDLDDELPEED